MADSKDKKTTTGKTKATASTAKTKKPVSAQAKENQTQAKNKTATGEVLTVSTLPTADALKARFKAGCIPLQTDFGDLIDMANIGRQAVGDSETGWGLKKDSQGRLQWDLTQVYNRSFDLSPAASNNPVIIENEYIGSSDMHNRIALLALDSSIGPTESTATKTGTSTTYNVKAVKIDSAGNKSDTTVSIIAAKNIGKGSDYKPFEYVRMEKSIYSFYIHFSLDVSASDYSNCTLVISPLMLSVNYVADVTKDTVGTPISVMNLHFTYNSTRQLIPKGLISMFSGSKVPDGWALCDGTNETPNLLDRFILGGKVADINTKNSVTLSGDKTSKIVSVQTTDVTPSIKVKVDGHSLTTAEMPSHSHSVSGTSSTGGTHIAFDCHTDGGYSGSATTTSAGGGGAHTHTASATQDTHKHSVDITVPYYVLAFIMKS